MISNSLPVSCIIFLFLQLSVSFSRELQTPEGRSTAVAPWTRPTGKEKCEMSFSAAVAFFLATWDTELEDELGLKAAHCVEAQ